jgi:hypothetical protein
MQAVKAAKEQLDLPFKVMPMQAVPGNTTRVLAFSEPPFACDYALVTRPEALPAALSWVLSDKDDPRATMMAGWLSKVLGKTVVELASERVESRVKFE